MYIPRQYAPAQCAQRDRLDDELRRTIYWRRLVQARVDLLVAALLYAAPVPAQRTVGQVLGGGPQPDLSPSRPTDDAFFPAPEGIDLGGLLDCAPSGGQHVGPGARLDSLREASRLLGQHERNLRLERTSVELADH